MLNTLKKSFIANSLWNTDVSDWLVHNSLPIMMLDTAYSGAHAAAQHTGVQLETMSQALFRGLF